MVLQNSRTWDEDDLLMKAKGELMREEEVRALIIAILPTSDAVVSPITSTDYTPRVSPFWHQDAAQRTANDGPDNLPQHQQRTPNQDMLMMMKQTTDEDAALLPNSSLPCTSSTRDRT